MKSEPSLSFNSDESAAENIQALVEAVRAGQHEPFERLMRLHNQRLYRIARCIVRNEHDAEDVVQDAYLAAYKSIDQYEGRSPVGAWLSRIAVNAALTHLRRRAQIQSLEETRTESDQAATEPGPANLSPESLVASQELRRIIERAIDALPEKQRTVFVMRELEGMSGSEVSEALGISEVDARVALHRARARIKAWLGNVAGHAVRSVFGFGGERCDRIVQGVFDRLAAS